MTPLGLFDRTLAEVDAIVAHVEPSQLSAPTLCGTWDVRALINHLTHVNLEYAALANGQTYPDDGADILGDNVVAAFRASGRAARDAFARPGMLEQRYGFPWGPEPGARIVRHVANELLVHGWDLARATGQRTDFAPDLAEASLADWQAWFDQHPRWRLGDLFRQEQPVPEGASAADRLAAYLGRAV